jgi:hypothetical protein
MVNMVAKETFVTTANIVAEWTIIAMVTTLTNATMVIILNKHILWPSCICR